MGAEVSVEPWEEGTKGEKPELGTQREKQPSESDIDEPKSLGEKPELGTEKENQQPESDTDEPQSADDSSESDDEENTGEIIERHQQMTKTEAEAKWKEIIAKYKFELEEEQINEMFFINGNFKQRICTTYCPVDETDYCECGLSKDEHTKKASRSTIMKKWLIEKATAPVPTTDFGQIYLDCFCGEANSGDIQKYIRVDDLMDNAGTIHKLLIDHWKLSLPELVISVTGGNPAISLEESAELVNLLKSGLQDITANTKTWVITGGLLKHRPGKYMNGVDFDIEDMEDSSAAYLGAILHNEEFNSEIYQIGIAPWGITSGTHLLHGEYLDDIAFYEMDEWGGKKINKKEVCWLEPHQTAFLLCDDGTHGQDNHEPLLRGKLEQHIRKTPLKVSDDMEISTPVVILVLGGDKYTIAKVAWAVQNNIAVVIVNKSGDIATMLADMVTKMEAVKKCTLAEKSDTLSGMEDKELKKLIENDRQNSTYQKYLTEETEKHLAVFMTKRHLVTILGTERNNAKQLSQTIALIREADAKNIVEQLHLAVLTDNTERLRELIKQETKKNKAQAKESVHEVLLYALLLSKPASVGVFMDFESEVKQYLTDFPVTQWLHRLYKNSIDADRAVSKVLKNLTGMKDEKKFYTDKVEESKNLLTLVGKIIFKLLGNNYRILYQEKRFEKGADGSSSNNEPYMKLPPTWHIFVWAVLTNEKEIAELFWYHSSCKIGTALMAFKMFRKLAVTADSLRETDLQKALEENAIYFENLAMSILDNLYAEDRYEAYRNLASELPFELGRYLTPMHIAYNAGARDFLAHACCQTLLKLIWMNSMDLDTPAYKLIPLFAPFNIHFIKFEDEILRYAGSCEKDVKDQLQQPTRKLSTPAIKQNRRSTTLRKSTQKMQRTDTSSTGDVIPEQIQKKQVEQERRTTLRKKSHQKRQGTDSSSTDDAILKLKPNPTGKDVRFVAKNRRQFMWFCVKSYFTAPINKFVHSFVSYLLLLGILTHFVLTELRPLNSDGVAGITTYEWLVYIWTLSIICQEIMQIFYQNTSGPLYMVKDDCPSWHQVWSLQERLAFRLFKLTSWLFDVWNIMDFLLIIMFVVSLVLRFTLERQDFSVARICFCITLLLYYFRFLRFGYILKQMGPRIIVIATLLSDLVYFMVILMVFIVSFGVAFQALIDPNQEPSLQLLGNVLWRGYWQMLGEIFLDDATEGMGLEQATPRNCTTDRELAQSQPEFYEHCQEWFLPILLGLFMMITNILLLNLLIAIFSNSFEKAEAISVEVWQYHLFDLYHEYYSQVWVAPPFNIVWNGIRIVVFVIKKCMTYCPRVGDSRDPLATADNLFCLPECYRNNESETKAFNDFIKHKKKKSKDRPIKETDKQTHKTESKTNVDDLQKELKELKADISATVGREEFKEEWSSMLSKMTKVEQLLCAQDVQKQWKGLTSHMSHVADVAPLILEWQERRAKKKGKGKKTKEDKYKDNQATTDSQDRSTFPADDLF